MEIAAMKNYRFALSLQLRHPFADLRSFAKAIGRAPAWIWKKGERKANAQGELIGDVMQTSYCVFNFRNDDEFDLNAAIVSMLQAFETAKPLLQDFFRSEGEASISIGWFSHGDSGEILNAELIRKIASLGMSVHFHIYCE